VSAAAKGGAERIAVVTGGAGAIVRFPLVVIAHCWAMFRFTTSTDTSNRRATSSTDRPS
jgi:hypothetical protein